MLVSKIKPCTFLYKPQSGDTANGSLYQIQSIWCATLTWITVLIVELIHVPKPDSSERLCSLVSESSRALPGALVIHGDWANRIASADDEPSEYLTYQLPTVGYWPTVAMTGDGGLGFDSGEGA